MPVVCAKRDITARIRTYTAIRLRVPVGNRSIVIVIATMMLSRCVCRSVGSPKRPTRRIVRVCTSVFVNKILGHTSSAKRNGTARIRTTRAINTSEACQPTRARRMTQVEARRLAIRQNMLQLQRGLPPRVSVRVRNTTVLKIVDVVPVGRVVVGVGVGSVDVLGVSVGVGVASIGVVYIGGVLLSECSCRSVGCS